MVRVEDINVDFPYEPYECQMAMMREVIKGIENKWDVAIESPTGTGKTMALLCGALAWQENKGVQINKNVLSQRNDPSQAVGETVRMGKPTVPQIFYCSRTHSQLKQVVRQLNATTYKNRVSASILASRDNLCNSTSALKPSADMLLQAFCAALRKKHTCEEYNNLENADSDALKENYKQMDQCLDIEELTTIANKHRQCAYFLSRQMAKEANLVLLPYNYLINIDMMQRFELQLANAIVIFDEAHNLESQCEEEASTSITTTVIARAIHEIQQAITILNDEIEDIRLQADVSEAPFGQQKDKKEKSEAFNVQEAGALLEKLFHLEEEINKAFQKYRKKPGVQNRNLPEHVVGFVPGKPNECSMEGKVMLEILQAANFDLTTGSQTAKLLDNMAEYLETRENPALDGKFMRAISGFFSIISATHCSVIALIMKQAENRKAHVGNEGNELTTGCASGPTPNAFDVAKHYKLHMDAAKITDLETGQVKIHSKGEEEELEIVLNYMCFTAVPTMRFLKMKGVRCVITASGTLAPLELFTANLGLNFGGKLENMHVAKPNQLLIGKLGKAPNGSTIRGTAACSTPEYFQHIVQCLLEMEKVVPQGMLVFFKSKDAIYKAHDAYKRLLNGNHFIPRKKLFVEPDRAVLVPPMLAEYKKTCSTTKEGAMLFAVMRGRMSEGIDFADCESRAVVIVSLPFMNLGSERVKLKKLHLDKTTKGGGERWYTMDAQRTCNQSIGRVLRHAKDFGAVALLDDRFTAQPHACFPKWTHPSIKNYDHFSSYIADLRSFFALHKCDTPAQQAVNTFFTSRKKAEPSKSSFFNPNAFATFNTPQPVMPENKRKPQPLTALTNRNIEKITKNETAGGQMRKSSGLAGLAAASNTIERYSYAKVTNSFGAVMGLSSTVINSTSPPSLPLHHSLSTAPSTSSSDVVCLTSHSSLQQPSKKKFKLASRQLTAPSSKETGAVRNKPPVVTLDSDDDDDDDELKRRSKDNS